MCTFLVCDKKSYFISSRLPLEYRTCIFTGQRSRITRYFPFLLLMQKSLCLNILTKTFCYSFQSKQFFTNVIFMLAITSENIYELAVKLIIILLIQYKALNPDFTSFNQRLAFISKTLSLIRFNVLP